MQIIAAILLISLLVIIHEFGHCIVARAFGMRVLTFSIGYGPVLLRWRPKGSETIFQIAAIPVLAYVQIAGTNPREASTPDDQGSYQNARPIARFLTIAGGPLANYLAASLLWFAVTAFGGEPTRLNTTQIGEVQPNTPAATAGLRPHDVLRTINGTRLRNWDHLLEFMQHTDGKPLSVELERAGQALTLTVQPNFNPQVKRFTMGIAAQESYQPVSFARAVQAAVVMPAELTVRIVQQLGAMVRREVPVQLVGPVGIVAETVQQTKQGWRSALEWISIISLQLFIFNLLPIPALDGGRLLVLAYEMIWKRKPNPQVEQRVLTYSLIMMLGLFLVVTAREVWTRLSGLFSG